MAAQRVLASRPPDNLHSQPPKALLFLLYLKFYIILCSFIPGKSDFRLFAHFFIWHFPWNFAIIM